MQMDLYFFWFQLGLNIYVLLYKYVFLISDISYFFKYEYFYEIIVFGRLY